MAARASMSTGPARVLRQVQIVGLLGQCPQLRAQGVRALRAAGLHQHLIQIDRAHDPLALRQRRGVADATAGELAGLFVGEQAQAALPRHQACLGGQVVILTEGGVAGDRRCQLSIGGAVLPQGLCDPAMHQLAAWPGQVVVDHAAHDELVGLHYLLSEEMMREARLLGRLPASSARAA